MALPSINVQRAIFSALTLKMQSEGHGVSIYDNVPSGTAAAFPYITIGDDIIRPSDVKGGVGFEVETVIYVWSKGAGRGEVKELLSDCYDALRDGAGNPAAGLSVADYTIVDIDFNSMATVMESDGVTYRGTLSVTFLIE